MKKKVIAVAVSTREALQLGIQNHFRLMAVENPLYSEVYDKMDRMPGLLQYTREEYPDKEIVILKKSTWRKSF